MKYLLILLWKKISKKLLPILLQNILYKTLFATNFVENTCKFYNFVGNNYPRKNYLPIKILRKISRKKFFLANVFNKFARKFSCNMRIFSIAKWTFIYLAPFENFLILFWDKKYLKLIKLFKIKRKCIFYIYKKVKV